MDIWGVMEWPAQVEIMIGSVLCAGQAGFLVGMVIKSGKFKDRPDPQQRFKRPKRDRSRANLLGTGEMDDLLK